MHFATLVVLIVAFAWFCVVTLFDWLKNSRATFSTNQKQNTFSARRTSHVCLLRVLIGSLHFLYFVIGQSNIFSFHTRHSTKNLPFSKVMCFILVHLKLGEVADPYAPVWIQLVGEKGESGQIQIKPGYGPNDKFEKGRIYKVVARVADIGRVSN